MFSDAYASWAIFPKPPYVRRAWGEEFEKLGRDCKKEEEASWSLCLRLLEECVIKVGVFRLGEETKEFYTF